MDNRESCYVGCLLGLATGDAMGAPYEGGWFERLIWRLMGKTSDGCLRWTDDTQMALDLAESVLANGALYQDELASRFAESYRWSRGYGPGAARILAQIRKGLNWREAARKIYKDGSYGNGAAMRSPVIALFFPGRLDQLVVNASAAAEITHAHPIGIDGAVLVAVATSQLLARRSIKEVLDTIAAKIATAEMRAPFQVACDWLENDTRPEVSTVVNRLGNSIVAHKSCVTALYIALRFLHADFSEMMQFIISCGGDVDTLGSMAGGLWGVYNGCEHLPTIKLEQRERLIDTAQRLYRATSSSF